MTYMALSSRETPLYLRKNYLMAPFSYSVRTFRVHPTTLLLKILGRRMHGPFPYLKFCGTVPPEPLKSPPMLGPPGPSLVQSGCPLTVCLVVHLSACLCLSLSVWLSVWLFAYDRDVGPPPKAAAGLIPHLESLG